MERKKKQAELEQVGGGLFGGLEKRMMERGRWEEECRIKEAEKEVVRRREEGERLVSSIESSWFGLGEEGESLN